MKRFLAISVTAAYLMVMTGCADKNMDDSTRTKAEGTAVGAALGGIVGALIGDEKGALIGAAVGATAGYLYGSHVAQEKEKYASQEDWLDGCIASAQKVNHETKAYNEKLAGQLQDMKAETERLVKLYEQKKAKKSEVLAQKKKIDTLLKESKEKLARAEFELENQQLVLEDMKKNGTKEDVANIDREIETLKKEIATLKKNTEELASMSALAAV